MRLLKIVLLVIALIPVVFLRDPPPAWCRHCPVILTDLMPSIRKQGLPDLGGLVLAGAWQISSRDDEFGNFSGLAQFRDGTMVAPGDKNGLMWFTRPDGPRPWRMRLARPFAGAWWQPPFFSDAEAVAIDPASQTMLLAYEDTANMFRFREDLTGREMYTLPELGEWARRAENQGPEAMTLLADGRLVMIGELYERRFDRRTHPGLVFAHVPRPGERAGHFTLTMPEGFRPTDMTQLPDGRVLVLGRKLTLMGFRSVVVLVDPQVIRAGAVVPTREIARIADSRIRDNYEGMTVTDDGPGHVAIWLISDSNQMSWVQRTLLLKLRFPTR